MRKLLLITVSLTFLLTSCASSDSEVLETCKKFLEYWGSGDINAALSLSEGEQIKTDIRKYSIMKLMDDITFLNHSVDIMDKSFNDDKTELKLQLQHEFTYDPPGVHSSFGTMKAVFIDGFTLKKTSDGWKVASFSPDMQELIERQR
jgi:hypothetical protein